MNAGLISAFFGTAISAIALSGDFARGADVRFFRVSSTGAASAEPLASGENFLAREDAEFVKFVWVFEKPVRITRVEAESCGESFTDGAEFLLGFSSEASGARFFAEGGRAIVAADLTGPEAQRVLALTINFGHSHPVCLKEARFFEGKKRIPLKTATLVPGAVVTTIKAQAKTRDWRIDSALNLFDSRPETGWVATPASDTVTVDFEKSVKFDRLRVWSGDQRSLRDFRYWARPEKLQLKGDGGYSEAVSLADAAGVQDVVLKKPFSGKKISILVEAVYEGATDLRAALSELRFVGRDGEFVPSRVRQGRQKEIEEKNIDVFSKSQVSSVLDHELKTRGEDEKWTFRLRADGSFFMKGVADETGTAHAFQGFGTFDANIVDKGRLSLSLRGAKASANFVMDSESCPLACGATGSEKGEVIDEVVELEKAKNGSFMIRNRTRRSDRTLPFGDLQVRLTSLQE